VIIASDRFRTQSQNLKDAIMRLRKMLETIWLPPKERIATEIPQHAEERRLKEKKERSTTKEMRRTRHDDM
jgi:ribosome-associated protein